MRAAHPDLTDPSASSLAADCLTPDAEPGARAYRLSRGGLDILVNLTAEPVEFAGVEEILLSTGDGDVRDGSVVLPAETAAVVARA